MELLRIYFWLWIIAIPMIAYVYWRENRCKNRLLNIRCYVFPQTILKELQSQYPQLNYSQICLVEQELKEYFCAVFTLKGWTTKRSLIPTNNLPIPSKIAHDLWQIFINTEDTAYMNFCLKSFGFYLSINNGSDAQKYQNAPFISCELSRVWKTLRDIQYFDDHNDKNQFIPSLFTLDTRLNLNDGYHYDIEQFKEEHFEELDCS